MDVKKIINTLGVISLAYVGGNLIVYNTVGAKSYFEATGYLNGLIRGAGSETAAMNALMDWRHYWLSSGAMEMVVNQLYSYGISTINTLYNASSATYSSSTSNY